MTNNDFNEFENTDLERLEEEDRQKQQARTGIGSKLSHAWQTQPFFKLLILMTVVAAIVAASVSFFSGRHSSNETAHIVNPPDIHEASGGPSSPFVQQQTRLANEQRAQEALSQNGSALPTPIGQSADVGDLLNRNKTDPLNELRTQVEQLQKQQAQQQVQQKQQAVQQKPPEQFDDSLAQAMQRQMQALMDGWTPKGIKQVTVIKPEDTKNETSTSGAETAAAGRANAAGQGKIVVPAGTVSYAQLLTEANSDVPGPILAQIVSGPLSGARAVGQFKVTNSYDDYLILSFTLADLKGKEYSINAIALDPNTTLGGLATEVDQRYFARVILPAAAGFLQGFGSALGENSVTTTTNGNFAITQSARAGFQQGIFQGLDQAANTTGEFFQNQANQTKPLVRVAAGTPIGMFFVASVRENPGADNTAFNGNANGYGNALANGYGVANNGYGLPPNQANPYLNNGYGNPQGYYPGNTVAGYGNQNNNNVNNSVPYPNYANPGVNNPNAVNSSGNFSVTPGIGNYYH